MRRLFLVIALLLAPAGAFAYWHSVAQQIAGGAAPTVELNFAGNTATGCSTLTSCLTVTRASAETCTDASGNITYATSGNACITSAGLQVFATQTNIVVHSAQDSGWSLTNATSALNATPPDGNANTATTLTDNSTNAAHIDVSGNTGSVTSATTYTISCFVKAGTGNFAQIYPATGQFSGAGGINVNLTTGAVQSFGTATIPAAQQYANGWWRASFQAPATATAATTLTVGFGQSIADARASAYVGSGSTILFWGCQIDTSLPLTPYIPTTSTSVTRAADNIATTSTLSSTLNSATGTLVMTVAQSPSDQSDNPTFFDSNGTVLLARLVGNTCTTSLGAVLTTGNTAHWDTATNTCGLSWNASGGIIQLNAGNLVTDAQARTPSATSHIGSISGSSAFINTVITDIKVYNTKLANPVGAVGIMTTPILSLAGSGSSFPSTSSTNYVPFIGGNAATTPSGTVANKQSVIATAGTINNLQVSFPTTISSGTYAISLNLGGSSQALTCTVQSGTQTCTDSAHPITVAPGNLVAWQITPASTPTVQAAPLQISATFTSTVGQESPLFGGDNNFSTQAAAINYDAFGAAVSTNVTTENLASVVIPTAGTIDQLYMQLSAGAGASATYTVTVEHGGSDSSLTCVTATAGSTCSDTNVGHAITVAQGDTISLKICPSNTATCPAGSAPTARQVAVGVRWVPTASNQALLFDTVTTVPTTNSTRFGTLNGAGGGTSTEVELNVTPVVSGGMTIKNLTVLLAPVPGGSTTRAINLRAGTGSGQATVGSPGNMTCTVTSAATTCADNTDIYSSATGTYLNWQTVPTGTNAALTQFKVSEVVTVP